jgi:5-methylcytosine-specific restriction endonuclease McrA
VRYPKDRRRKCPRQKPCTVCGGPISEAYANGQWRKRVRTCSPRCEGLRRRKARRAVECRHCQTTFEPRPEGGRTRQFCSAKCRLDFERGRRWAKSDCAACGSTFTRDRTQLARQLRKAGRAFCSRRCTQQFIRGEQHGSWRGGSDPNRGHGWRKRAEEARKRDGYRCRRCGKTQAENGQKLSVDHIRPWREFESADEANALENLASLCRGCHSWKTNTLEKRWLKGDGLALAEYRRWIEQVGKPTEAA